MPDCASWWVQMPFSRTAAVLVLLLLLTLAPAPVLAQSFCQGGAGGWGAVSYQELTLDATTVQQIDLRALPPAPTNYAMALVSVENATARFTFGPPPTGDSGHELVPGTNFVLCGRTMIEQWRAIRSSQGAVNAVVRITLFQPL
jgi:hypothetical protein